MKAIVTTDSGFTFNHYMRAGQAHFNRIMKIYINSGWEVFIP
jgi:hypothetical protein